MIEQVEQRINFLLPQRLVVEPRLQAVYEAITTNRKRTGYTDLDAIVITGSSMDYSSRRGRWQFNTVVTNGIGGLDGGQSKADAARQLVDEGYRGLFLVTGGVETDPDTGQTASKSEELARVMVDDQRIPQYQVRSIGTEGNTFGNARDVLRFILDNSDAMSNEKIGILTNEWNMVRAMLIFNTFEAFRDRGIELVPILADDILIRKSRQYEKWLDAIEDSEVWRTKLDLEAAGIAALLDGTYSFRHN